MNYFLVMSLIFNWVFILFYAWLGRPFWHMVKANFTRRPEYVHISKNRKIERILLKDENSIPKEWGLKDVHPEASYYDPMLRTQVVFSIGEEPRAYEFFSGSYAEQVRDEDSGDVTKVGRVYRSGDGPSKLLGLIAQQEAEAARLEGAKPNNLLLYIAIFILLIVLAVLVIQLFGLFGPAASGGALQA